MRYGVLAYDVSHMLGGAALALSFVLLYQRRAPAVINAYAAQALVLAVSAAWQGWVQGAAALYLTAAITLVAKGIVTPLILHRIVRRLAIGRTVEAALGVFHTMMLGVAVVALSILVVLPISLPAGALTAGTMTREGLAFALSVVLLGLLTMITRRTAITQVIGFLSMENGVILAAVGLAGMPLLVELTVAALVLVALSVFGLFVFRIRGRLGSLDISILDTSVLDTSVLDTIVLDRAGRAQP